ncbi:MAG TPA: biopolymer transporter ExbD [Pirellulales bacterium]|nr:biopolymer transporter ExbD [Pirellulales bacterium]
MTNEFEAHYNPHDDPDEPPIKPRKAPVEDTEMDITPMIDCTFLLLIFFTVTSTPDAQTALNLAPAKHGVGISIQDSFIISVADAGEGRSAEIYLADGKVGKALEGTPAEQETQIKQAVEEALASGKTGILIKAEKGVLHRDVSRVASAAGSVGDVGLNLAVMESK